VTRHLTLAAVAVVVVVAVAGCAGAGAARQPEPSGTTSVTAGGPVVVSTDDAFRFTPDRVVVDRGEPLRIELRHTGSYPHNLAVPALDVTSDTVSGDFGRSTTRFRVDTSRPGTYRFICTFHDEAGMTGRLVVR
jgi:plastocyanin